MNSIELIENYIVYLITECNLSVTIHPMEKENLITFSRLMRFNIHDNSYCTCIKSSANGYARCLAQQRSVLKKCKVTTEDFCGICHAGVFEYVYPLYDGKRTLGFISVSGYSCENGEVHIRKAAKLVAVSYATLLKNYATLRVERPDKQRIDTLILPLCRMIELAYRCDESNSTDETLITQICRYIAQNYAATLTTEEICQNFHCSRSYFSHTFKHETGKSFREYLMEIRMEHAKRLLRYSNLNITEISFSVGFNDANYFSNVFKRRLGLSPLSYRKMSR